MGGAAAVMAIMSVASAAMSYKKGEDAEDAAFKQSRINADIKKQNTKEEKRRLEDNLEYRDSLGRAKLAASGVGGDSAEIYLKALEDAGQEELDWLEKVGSSEYNAALAGGEYASVMAGTGGQTLSHLGSAVGYGYEAYNA